MANNMKPVFYNPQKETLDEFKKRFPVERELDTYKEQLEELFLIRNPKYKFNPNYKEDFDRFFSEHLGGKTTEQAGSWVFFSWNNTLVHYLSDELHQELRTARNKNLITKEEQEKFYSFKVGIGGLSVGSHAALTLAMMGGGREIRISDPDEISGSNLNRIRGDFTQVGLKKIDVVTRQIYQMNPYGSVGYYPEGLNAENVGGFVKGLDIVVDELDNFELKIRLRMEAKKNGLPLIMATDNGDNVIFDIERYDLDKDLKLFNGAIGDFGLEDLKTLNPVDIPKFAGRIAGPSFVVPRMLASVMEVGKTLYSWPQLGSAATLSGVAVAYVVRRIALGERIKSGKLEVNLDKAFYEADIINQMNIERDQLLQKWG